MNSILKTVLGHAAAICVFLVVVLIYFAPSVFDGKVLKQGDTEKVIGMGEELSEYYKSEHLRSAWTGSMFSGMPSYHIYVHGNPPNYLTYVEKPVKVIDYYGGSMVLAGLISFYILMCIMGVNRWLAVAGSIAFALASYNFIIIVAGHVTKAYVIAYMPLTVAGLVLLFKKKYVPGAALLTLAIALSVMNNHLQITYYLALFCLFFYAGFLVAQCRKKDFGGLGKITAVIVVCILLAVVPNLGNLYANAELSKETTRGASELTTNAAGNEVEASSGLDKQYAFMWSYGEEELLTLLIPNVYGGSSVETLDNHSAFYKAWKSLGQQAGKDIQAPTYWGDQPFTSGPVYFGALICFLFVLGMFIIKNPIKWWLAGASLFFIFLSLGRNMDWLNGFMFNYLPMYSKFRTPSMALVIPGMVFPFVGIWGLKEILTQRVEAIAVQKSLIWSASITGGICLIIWLIPGLLLNFESPLDAKFSQWPQQLYGALLQDRRSLASSDALRSLIFILLGASLLFYFLKTDNKKQANTVVSVGVVLLILIDLWTVDKRYLNDHSFSKEKITAGYQETVADKEILKDKDPSYRVLNLQNTFEETNTSYYHKSIGGYHAAKLRRYQELIDFRLTKEINENIIQSLQQATTVEDMMGGFAKCNSLNMLNARYIVYSQDQAPIPNPYAFGNAWFVDTVQIVNNANEDIALLNTINPLTTAVIDKRFADYVQDLKIVPDSTAQIVLDSYKPNELVYTSNVQSDQLAIFSEIYYEHGWKAYIDGQPAPHFRADWTLRGMVIPAGKHEIAFKFIPEKYYRAVSIASIGSGIILLLLLLAVGLSIKNMKNKK